MPQLRFNNVHYRWVLQGIDAVLPGGELIGLIGPNGAGKSTLLRLAAGVWTPTAGRVTLDGHDVHRWTPRQRAVHLTYLPQQPLADVPYTVREFVEMGRYARRSGLHAFSGNATGTSQIVRALAAMELTELADVPLSLLSGGERQRAAIARCLAQECDTWLLDEPISNLDPYYQMDILRRLRALADAGYLIVLAIHHLELAAQFCTRLALVHGHTISAFGAPHEVLQEDIIGPAFRIRIRTYRDPYTDSLRISCQPLA